MPSLESTSPPFSRISIANIEGKAHSLRLRQSQFHRLREALVREKEILLQSLRDDFGFSELEALFEYSLVLLELRHHYDSLDLQKEIAAINAIGDNRQTTGRSVGTGIVYVKPQNGMYSVLSPFLAALSAGNCVIVELPQTTMRTSSALRNLLNDTLDQDIFAISRDSPQESFAQQCTVVDQTCAEPYGCWQKLIYSPTSTNSFIYVDRGGDLKLAARCIVASRFGFRGTSSYAPAAVFVHEAVFGLLSTHLIAAASSTIGRSKSNGAVKMNGYAKSGDERRSKEKESSLAALTETAGATLLFSSPHGAIVQTDDSSLLYLLETDLIVRSSVPVLLLCSVSSTDMAIDLTTEFNTSKTDHLTSIPRPTGAFIFATPADAQYLANSIDADLTCINNFPAQLMVGPRIPKSTTGCSNFESNTNLMPRYSRHMFEEHRIVVQRQGLAAKMLGDAMLVTEGKEGRKQFLELTKQASLPLTPTGQALRQSHDIFHTGLMISLSMVGIPIVCGLGWLGRIAWGRLSGGGYFGHH